MKSNHGFTLIELMIVVAIIAILAAIAISQYQDYIIRTQVSEAAALSAGMKTSVTDFVNDKGYFPAGAATNSSYGLAAPTSIKGKFVDTVSVDSGIITATFGSQANSSIVGEFLTFSPITHAGSVEWVCNRSNLIQVQWVPAACRN